MQLWRITTGWKEILTAAGTGFILWGYYQLFAVNMEKAMLGKTVTTIAVTGEVPGRVIAVKPGKVLIARDGAVEEVHERSIIKIDNISLFDYERKRAVKAVCLSVSGGIVVWIALFFL